MEILDKLIVFLKIGPVTKEILFDFSAPYLMMLLFAISNNLGMGEKRIKWWYIPFHTLGVCVSPLTDLVGKWARKRSTAKHDKKVKAEVIEMFMSRRCIVTNTLKPIVFLGDNFSFFVYKKKATNENLISFYFGDDSLHVVTGSLDTLNLVVLRISYLYTKGFDQDTIPVLRYFVDNYKPK